MDSTYYRILQDKNRNGLRHIHNLGILGSALLTRSGGATVHVPVKDGLVLVGGEVLFTNTIAFEQKLSVQDY